MTGEAGGTGAPQREILAHYEEDLLGIPVVLKNAVIREVDAAGDETIEVPDLDGLTAAVAVARCRLPVKLAGAELRFFRKALEMTAREMAELLDVTPETLSRWENDAQAIGEAAEKAIRQAVCALLHRRAPAVDYDPAEIVRMRIMRLPPGKSIEPLVFERVKLKDAGVRTVSREWDLADPLAA